VMNIIDFDMNIQEAIAAPKISFIEPDFLGVEKTIPNSVVEELKFKGHNIRLLDRIGNAHGLTILYDESGNPISYFGGSDPRGSGSSQGY